MDNSNTVLFFTKNVRIKKEILNLRITFGKKSIFETETYTEEELKIFFKILSYLDFGVNITTIHINDENDVKNFSIALIVLQKIGYEIKMVYEGAREKNYIDYKFKFISENNIIQPVIYPGDLYIQIKKLNGMISNPCDKNDQKKEYLGDLKRMTEDVLDKMDSKCELYKKYIDQIEKYYKN